MTLLVGGIEVIACINEWEHKMKVTRCKVLLGTASLQETNEEDSV